MLNQSLGGFFRQTPRSNRRQHLLRYLSSLPSSPTQFLDSFEPVEPPDYLHSSAYLPYMSQAGLTPSSTTGPFDTEPYEGAHVTEVDNKKWIIYPERATPDSEETEDIRQLQAKFQSWWSNTRYGSGREPLPCSQPGKNRIDKVEKIWQSSSRTGIWQSFRQVANVSEGKPKVQCISCFKLFSHPKASKQGSGNLSRHMEQVHIAGSGVSSQIGSSGQQTLERFNLVCSLIGL